MPPTSITKPFAAFVIASLPLFLPACATNHGPAHAPTSAPESPRPSDSSFHTLSDNYLTSYLEFRPQSGTSLGLHQYDGKITDASMTSLEAEHTRLLHSREALAAIDPKSLSPQASRQRRALQAALESELLSFEVFHSQSRNPMTYAGAIDLTTYAQRDFAPKPQRLASVIAILNQAPILLSHGRANLEDHLPRTFITVAIDQATGTADFLTGDLVTAFADVPDPALQDQFKNARTTAAESFKSFAQWLKSDRLPKADASFPIGRDAYIRMLRESELLTQSPEEVLAIAMRELQREQQAFAHAAAEIDPTKPPKEVSAAVEHEHPTEQSLLPSARTHLESIRQFVLARDLVSFPSMVPVRIEETPKFARRGSFASMDSPGPFEKSTQAFYYITPTEPDWDARKKEEWLTRFNYYATDVTTIHEAYPGHYVQALHLKASSATPCEKAFGSYAFGEGWAHYCEQMLLEEGFPAGADPKTRAKYRLQQSQDALLRVCRLCVSVQMHCQGMTVDQATRFFMDNCYYAEAPAREEAIRGTFDPGYGFYTLGKLQILKLRDDYRRQEGNAFSLRKFHDALLDNGQPPIRILREILLKDRALWNSAL